MRPVTPRGFRDVLPAEALERRALASAASKVFAAWGYDPVETPSVEVFETLRAAAGDLEGTAFRLFDADGRLLALRPDMTVPIARLVAARLREVAGAKRFSYEAEVFREHESLRGQARQFTQLGIELVDADGPAADAEVIAVLVEVLAAAGLRDFQVAVGDVAVIEALLAQAPDAGGAWRASVRDAIHDRNLVTVDRLGAAPGVPVAVGEGLSAAVRMRGGREAIAECRATLERCGCADVLGDLEESWRLLELIGAADRCFVDFGVLRGFDYYTGLVFEAYAPGLGLALGGGGRYDSLLAAYDSPAPAAGFALGLDRVLIALAEQGVAVTVADPPVLVGGEASAAFIEAARLRAAGSRVRLAAGLTGPELANRSRSAGLEFVEAS